MQFDGLQNSARASLDGPTDRGLQWLARPRTARTMAGCRAQGFHQPSRRNISINYLFLKDAGLLLTL
jgi:hypothetical protein